MNRGTETVTGTEGQSLRLMEREKTSTGMRSGTGTEEDGQGEEKGDG